MSSTDLPSDFESETYLDLNPDVRQAGMDAAEHFLRFGRKERRHWQRKLPEAPIAARPGNADLLTSGVRLAAERMGAHFNCSPALHLDDHLIRYVLTHSPRSIEFGHERGIAEFFEGGANDAVQVQKVVSQLCYTIYDPILEFASGYGRVTRHLRNLKDLTSADIHPKAVEFLKSIGARAILSTTRPEDFNPEKQFQFIFVLSLFSHLPDEVWGRWLARLYDLLLPGGALLFTTNGETCAEKIPGFREVLNTDTGYGYLSTTDQTDLDLTQYASTVTLPVYVRRQIETATKGEGEIVDFTPAAWWLLQDQWIIRKG